MIKIENLTITYNKAGQQIKAIDNLCLNIESGNFATVRGPSGCGKTSLLLAIGAMLRPDNGTVIINDTNIYAMSPGQRNKFRAQNIGFVFQMFHLVPYLSVADNIMLAAIKRDKATMQRCHWLLEELGLTSRKNHRPAQLSTGEKQRTAIARAVLNNPAIILADEPTGNLDPDNADLVIHYLHRLQLQGHTVLMVTHSNEADDITAQKIQLRNGTLI